MVHPTSRPRPVFVRLALALLLIGLVFTARPTEAQAQDVMTAEAAGVIKAAFLADIEGMRVKFLGLAEAFPQDKYSWRPMEGVRSVSEVLMLIAGEGYGFAPTAMGGKPAMSREESRALSAITDKAQVIDHLNKAFAHAKQEIEGIDPATLVGTREMFGQSRNTAGLAMLVSGDMHEHLGQLIAYARSNQIVPPWSR